MVKNGNGSEYMKVPVLSHEILDIEGVQNFCKLGDTIKCFYRKISVKKVSGRKVIFMKVTNEKNDTFHLPVFILGFNQEQKDKLVSDIKRISEEDFIPIPSLM